MKSILELQLHQNIRFQVCTERPVEALIEVKQVHGPVILNPFEIDNNVLQEADGLVVEYSQLSKPINLAIKTADCLPLAIIGTKGMAILHAGWRGLSSKIISQPLVKKIEPQLAYIGPAIRELQYEVSADFQENFPSSQAFKTKSGKYFFNLVEEAQNQLVENYPSIQVIDSGICTFQYQLLHSYRRQKGSGRNWNILSFSL